MPVRSGQADGAVRQPGAMVDASLPRDGQSAPSRRRRAGRDAAALLDGPAPRPGIAGTAYDTAWLAGLSAGRGGVALFPAALQWLVEHQHSDGSWGGAVRYEHDRVLCTLAALAPLARFGRRAADRAHVDAGTRYLWQHGHLLASEPAELVGFEVLLPALVGRAQQAGIAVPPHLDVYGVERAHKLRLIPADMLYSPRVTMVHSLEFLGDQVDAGRLREAQGSNGSIGNSPAATAFYFTHSQDPAALGYLRDCVDWTGGATAPVLHPCETYELLWAAYHLFLAGVPAARLFSPRERRDLLAALRGGGVSLSPSFPIADADDTAVALLMLHSMGEEVDPSILRAFADEKTGLFASFPHERHASVGVNLHVLHALLRVPGYPDQRRAVDRLLDYLADAQIGGLYWIDKWHISPYYATAHALRVLAELPEDQAMRMTPLLERTRAWLRYSQNADGSWGFYGAPTAEETAYGVLALTAAQAVGGALAPEDNRRCAAAVRWLKKVRAVGPDGGTLGDGALPPLWIDKCLYTPTLVVRAVIESALAAYGSVGARREIANVA